MDKFVTAVSIRGIGETMNMTGGGNFSWGAMGGYGGGLWMQVLLAVIVVVLVVMLIRRNDK